MSDTTNFADELIAVGADLTGHFLLTTGKHSARFFLMARLVEHPHLLKAWAKTLADTLAIYDAPTVIGAAMGGILPAFAVAQASGRRALYAEKTPDGQMSLYDGALNPGERVIIIEDAVATGSSIRKVMSAINVAGGSVIAIGALVDRGTPIPWDVPFHSVHKLSDPIIMWNPDECPLCKQGVPLVRPKS